MAERSETLTDSCRVGDVVQLPDTGQPWEVTGPDGAATTVSESAETREVMKQPGVYGFVSGEQSFQVAVNLDPLESQTEPIDASRLESFDVRLGTQPTREELAGSLQKLKDI